MYQFECKKVLTRDENNTLYYKGEVVFATRMRNEQKFVDKTQKFDIEKLLAETKPIMLHKSDAYTLKEAKERYKKEIEAAYIIRKFEILVDLKKKLIKSIEFITQKLDKVPFFMVLTALENKYNGSKIVIERIEECDFPTIVIQFSDETYVIKKDGMQAPSEPNKNNLMFVKHLQRLYNFHYIYKIG